MVCLRDDREDDKLQVSLEGSLRLQLAVVHTSLLHRVHLVPVVILHLLRLVGDGSVLYVEARQKEVR